MVSRESVGHWRPMVVLTPMAPRLLPRLPRMRSNRQSVLKGRKRQLRRCWDQSHETAGTQAGLTPRGEGASKVLKEVRDGRALKGLAPQVGGSRRLVAEASPQGEDDIPRAPDEHQPAADVGRQPAHFLHLLRNRQRNLDCVSTISRIVVTARQERRVAGASTSMSIRLDSNPCPSRTRCLLPARLLLAKRTSPRFLAEMETVANITRKDDASSGMDPRLHKCACLGRH